MIPEQSDGGRGVKDDLGSMNAVHQPIERVVSTVADVHSNLSKLCLEDTMTGVAFHIIRRLEEE